MQEQDIERYLMELGQTLQASGIQQPIRMLMVGGAFMLTQLHNRTMTNDIDVLLKDIDDPDVSSAYQILKAAIQTIAHQYQLPLNWLNDVIGDALRNNGTVPDGTLWRSYDMLEIYIPPLDYILALKLFAGRDRDRDDTLALCQSLNVVTHQQAQAVIDRFIPDQQLQQLNHVDETLADLFP